MKKKCRQGTDHVPRGRGAICQSLLPSSPAGSIHVWKIGEHNRRKRKCSKKQARYVQITEPWKRYGSDELPYGAKLKMLKKYRYLVLMLEHLEHNEALCVKKVNIAKVQRIRLILKWVHPERKFHFLQVPGPSGKAVLIRG